MGVKETVVAKWMEAELIAPAVSFARCQHFARETIERFIVDHIFSDEAAQILGLGQLVVQKWARLGRLHPVAGLEEDGCHRYLFRRCEVERPRPANRLSAPELTKELGISRSTMEAWIAQGKVRPISGPGIDGCKHYLFVRDALEKGYSNWTLSI